MMRDNTDPQIKTGPGAADIIMFLISPALSFLLSELLLRNPFKHMYLRAVPLNLAFYYLATLFLFFLTGSLRAGLMSVTLWSMLFSTLNMYVYRFRSVPVSPWDIRSAGTALSVAGEYDFDLKPDKVLVFGAAALLVLCEFLFVKYSLNTRFTRKRILARLLGLCLSAFGITLLFLSLWDEHTVQYRYRLYDKLFTPDTMQYRDGTAVAFIMELKYLVPEIPGGYSEEKAESILEGYKGQEEKGRTPDVIVIMDEAFSDPFTDCFFTTNTEYMPFVKELMNGADNVVSGELNVSVKGGNTPNSEFEFLTGNTMAFLTEGSIPYQQYINGFIPSLVSHFKALGYETTAMHPYKPGGWNRDKAYGYLGFDHVYFEEDFKEWGHSAKLREYISDRADMDMVEDVCERNHASSDRPQFIFNVTMQNHSPYRKKYGNFSPGVEVEGVEADAQIHSYLSLIKETDAAFRDMVSYYELTGRDTVIVLFGDHQPADTVISPLWRMNGVSGEDLTPEQNCSRYKVPFVIWANYDIKEEKGLDTSLNYLSSVMCEKAGITLSPYQAFLLDVMEKYPVVSAKRVSDGGNDILTYDDVKDGLSDYAVVQYYRLFGAKEE